MDELLTKYGILRGNPQARRKLIAVLENSGHTLTEPALVRLLLHARDDLGAQRPAGMVCQWLQDGSWIEFQNQDDPLPPRPIPLSQKDLGAEERQRDLQRWKQQVNEWPEDWKEQELDRHLLAVWRGDLGKRSVEEAARRLGVSTERAQQGIDRELAREHPE